MKYLSGYLQQFLHIDCNDSSVNEVSKFISANCSLVVLHLLIQVA